MSHTTDQATEHEPRGEQIRPLVPAAGDGEVVSRVTSEPEHNFLASRGFKVLATVLFSVLVLVLCGSVLLSTYASLSSPQPPTEVLWTSLLTIFGILITGIFVFMTLRIDSGAIKEAQAVAQAEARRQAEFVAKFVAPQEAREVAEREGVRVAREESSKIAKEVSRQTAEVEAEKVARDVASKVAREVADSEFDRITKAISKARSH